MASAFELSKGDQFIIGCDISGSMRTPDCPGGVTRFSYMVETMKAFVSAAAEWDPDGVSFYTFNDELKAFPNVTSVEEINKKIATLRPGGGTGTHLAITAAYKEHKAAKSSKTYLMLFTDGEPSLPVEVERAIVAITKDVQNELEFRIAILTVGRRSPELQAWLTDLDDNLTTKAGAKYDIVKVEALEDVDFAKAIADAIEG